VSVASFLMLLQILNGLGGAGVALLTIAKDLKALGLKPDDLLPAKHESVVRAILAPAQSQSTAEDFIENTLGR
jgi:hypothetical protein